MWSFSLAGLSGDSWFCSSGCWVQTTATFILLTTQQPSQRSVGSIISVSLGVSWDDSGLPGEPFEDFLKSQYYLDSSKAQRPLYTGSSLGFPWHNDSRLVD